MRLLQELVGHRPLWPVLKANAYGHGADMLGRHLVHLGYIHLCVAHVAEAIELVEAGVQATIIVLSATLPANSEYFVAYGFEPVVCTLEMIESLACAAAKVGRRIAVHLKVDTGMGRIGIQPEEVTAFLDRCRAFPTVFVKGLMSQISRFPTSRLRYFVGCKPRHAATVSQCIIVPIALRSLISRKRIVMPPVRG